MVITTLEHIEERLTALRTVGYGDMVLTDDYNLSRYIISQYLHFFVDLQKYPELVDELRSWYWKMPEAKYMDNVRSEDWNNRIEALRVIGELVQRVTYLGSVNQPVPDEWYPFSALHMPHWSPTLKVIGLTYHKDHWDDYVNYKQYTSEIETKYAMGWKSYANITDDIRPVSEPITVTVTETNYTEKYSYNFINPLADVWRIVINAYYQMRSYDGKPIYVKWQISDGKGGWVDIGGEEVETKTTFWWHYSVDDFRKTPDTPFTPPLTVRMLAKRGAGSGGEVSISRNCLFYFSYYVHKFIGGAEYWFEALREWDRVKVSGQMIGQLLYTGQAGVHIYFVKSGESIAGKSESERLCISDRTDVEIVGHVYKPYGHTSRTVLFDHELDIFDYVKYLVVLFDDPFPDNGVGATMADLCIKAI
jgi:hypothetical protein